MPVSRHHPDTVTKHISWHHPHAVTKHISWHLPDTVTKQRSSDHLHVLCHLVCFVCYVKDRFLTSSILRSLEISMEGERLIYIYVHVSYVFCSDDIHCFHRDQTWSRSSWCSRCSCCHGYSAHLTQKRNHVMTHQNQRNHQFQRVPNQWVVLTFS